MLQADQARKAAQVARLIYEAMIRDIRAQTETAYYQALLDGALGEVQGTTVENLRQVLNVTQVAYSANQVTQTDFISAEYDLAAARQQQEQLRTAEANDETTINQLLYRRPMNRSSSIAKFELQPLTAPLDQLIDLRDRAAPGDSGSGAGADQLRDRVAARPTRVRARLHAGLRLRQLSAVERGAVAAAIAGLGLYDRD